MTNATHMQEAEQNARRVVRALSDAGASTATAAAAGITSGLYAQAQVAELQKRMPDVIALGLKAVDQAQQTRVKSLEDRIAALEASVAGEAQQTRRVKALEDRIEALEAGSRR
jgi:hypothetical protein